MMNSLVLDVAIGAYERRVLTVDVGLNPYHCNNDRDAPFARLSRDGQGFPFGGGISIQETYFFECLAKVFIPRRIFIIGNSFGWSTVVLSLIFSDAFVVAIDSGTEGLARQGIDLTNDIVGELRLHAKVVVAVSPQDVSSVIEEHLRGGVDLAFVDGLHTNDQQIADYRAIKPFLTEGGAIIFHDVINWEMMASFEAIQADWAGRSAVLTRTPSGMGICYKDSSMHNIGRVVQLFGGRQLRAEAP